MRLIRMGEVDDVQELMRLMLPAIGLPTRVSDGPKSTYVRLLHLLLFAASPTRRILRVSVHTRRTALQPLHSCLPPGRLPTRPPTSCSSSKVRPPGRSTPPLAPRRRPQWAPRWHWRRLRAIERPAARLVSKSLEGG